jgi:hypothetical protein
MCNIPETTLNPPKTLPFLIRLFLSYHPSNKPRAARKAGAGQESELSLPHLQQRGRDRDIAEGKVVTSGML